MSKVYVDKKKFFTKTDITGIALAILPIARFLLFGFVPLCCALLMAFLKMNSFFITEGVFCGFDNFIDVLNDPMFWKSITNTFYLAVSLPISLVIGILISVLMDSKLLRGKKFFRTVFFLPYVCSIVAITLTWRWMFDYNYGIINQFLGVQINWRGDETWYIPGLIIMTVWSTTGYKIILLTAALSAIDQAYYEAADLDGASPIQKFWHITLPAISPTVFFLLVTGMIGILQEFSRSQVWNQSGGPNNAGLTIVFYLYRRAFEYIEMGAASAVSWLLSIMILLITILNFKLSKKWVYYD